MKRRLCTLLLLVLALPWLLAGCVFPPARTPAPPNTLEVHFVDVGQGDAILILTPEGKVAVIDGGESGSGMLQYLRDKGIRKIDLMVATHGHSDHIGGLADVLEAIPVSEVVSNGQVQTSLAYERFVDAISGAQARYSEVKRGDRLQLGSLSLDVLNPGSGLDASTNNASLVLRLSYGKTAFLFAGDAEKETEEDMINAPDLDLSATVLKIGHHGSDAASTLEFLKRVKPVLAVYSAGAGNQWHHPFPGTLTRLNSLGIQTYGTDINGTIIITSDGERHGVTTARGNGPWVPTTPTARICLWEAA